MKRVVFKIAIVVILLVLCAAVFRTSTDGDLRPPDRRVETLTGAHARVVWLQDAWAHDDVFSDRSQVRLMAYDSRDPRGERILLPGPAPLRKPLLTPCGEHIVYSETARGAVWVLPWGGGTPRLLTEGLALALWRNPADGHTWAYVGRDPIDRDLNAFASLVRVRLDDPTALESVLSDSPVGRDNFQLSADGTRAGGLNPWPQAGVALLADEPGARGWVHHGRGCWTGLSPDNRYLLSILDGAHRNLRMVDTVNDHRWQVALAHAPGIDGHEVYHPRWSNHPRFIVITGPYKIRHGGNNIRGGGDSVEIHVGRFSDDFRSIEAWVQVTDNPHANFFPDLWVGPSDDAPPAPAAVAAAPVESPAAVEPAAGIRVRAELIEASPIPTVRDILPYRQALVANAYRVVEVLEGQLAHETLLAAHWVIRDGTVLEGASRSRGALYEMVLDDYGRRADLEGERLSIDVDDLLLPLYYDRTAEP